jgi:Tfp pilus assembly protein PilV
MALRKMTKRTGGQRGMSIIELLVAMLVLIIGITGCVCAIPFAIGTNFRNKQQSNSTAIAQMVVEKIMSVPAGSSPTLTLGDCAGNTPNIYTAGSVGGTGANVTSSGDIDYTEAQSSIPTGYSMNWTTCGSNGQQETYDVRWNIVSPDGAVKIITVSARLQAVAATNQFALPVTIRSLAGLGT